MRKILLVCLSFMVVGLPVHAQGTRATKIKAIAFDAFPILDPRPIAMATEAAFPGHGKTMTELWRRKMFEYQWLRAIGGQYEDFMSATEAGLVFAAKELGLGLDSARKDALLAEFMSLKMWPDASASIRELRSMGLELVFLSNMTEKMLRQGLRQAGLEKEFKHVLSTDGVRTYKPAPQAYALGVERLGLSKEEILFVAYAGWDVAGAKWYGYPTFWVNRTRAEMEELDVMPDASSEGLAGLVEYVARRNQIADSPHR